MNNHNKNAFEIFQNHLIDDPMFRHCILDARIEGNTLVVFCGCSRELSTTRQALRRYWTGDIEIFRPKELLVGSSISADEQFDSDTDPDFGLQILH